MAQATIIIKDVDDEKLSISVEFDPPIEAKSKTQPHCHVAAMKALNSLQPYFDEEEP